MMPGEANSPNGTLEAALKLYDEQQWFVLPTDPGAKKPYFGFTYKDRYGDRLPSREEVAAWPEWSSKSVRLGARTGAVSGIIVLDVDSQEAHDFVKSKGHPIGPMVQSPREGGGLHLYFKHPGFYVKSTVEVGGVEGLDIRGDYGIVVLPPSIDHKVGRSYEWIIPPEDVAVPDAPAWLVGLLKKQASSKERLDVPKIMAGVPEGQRDSTLNRLAGKFRYMNLPEDIAVPMIELAAERCKPPFNKAEARAKVKWAYTHYAPGEEIGPVLNIAKKDEQGERIGRLSLRNGRDLMQKEFPPIKWIVPDLIPAGSMLFGGAPKMGKSWAALGLCISVATGGLALGAFPVIEGDCCYLALEDVERRLQDRAGQILKSNLAGHQDLSRWQYTETSGRIDQGLLEDIEEEFIKEVEDPRLVIIDTLAAVKPPGAKSQNMYDQDYGALKELTAMANEYRVGMVVVTHLNQGDHKDQMNRITGSAGLTGGVDGALILDRVRGEADAVLIGWHRDLKVNPELALEQVEDEQGFWRYMGDAEEYRMGKQRRQIIEVLSNADGPLKPMQIAELVEVPTPTVSKTLQRMREEGYLNSPGWGLYEVAAFVELPPTLSISRPNSPNVQVKDQVESELGHLDSLDRGLESAKCIHEVIGGCWLCNKEEE